MLLIPVSETTGILIVIISFAIGSIIGSALNIEKGLDNLGLLFERGFNKLFNKNKEENSNFSEGFIQATMVFCIGAMVIYGSLQAGLGDRYKPSWN